MKFIKHSFKIDFHHLNFSVMYSELNDGRFVKTFIKNNMLKTEFIKTNEYASTLAFIYLKNYMPNIPSA